MVKKASLVIAMAILAGCNPTVRVELSDKPIEINMNIKHEIYVKVEKEVEEMFADDEGLF